MISLVFDHRVETIVLLLKVEILVLIRVHFLFDHFENFIVIEAVKICGVSALLGAE